MDLTKIPDDQLRLALTCAVSEGRITEEQLKDWIRKNPSNETKRVIDKLHGLLCKLDHDTACRYYKEEELAECWTLPDHEFWLANGEQILESLGNPGELVLSSMLANCMAAYANLKDEERLLFQLLYFPSP